MSYFDSYKNASGFKADLKDQRPRKSVGLIAPPDRGALSENKSFNLVLLSTPYGRVDSCAEEQKIEEIEEIEENNREKGPQFTSRFIKALGYFFSSLEDYHFLKNEAYTFNFLLPIRNVYHYFRLFKLERPEEILKRINRQTPSLPPLTQEDFREIFNYFLKKSEIDDSQDWQLSQQVTSHLKITRSCCQELRKQSKKIIAKIINNENYNPVFNHFLKKKASRKQKKIFLENVITAHHLKEKQEFYWGDLEHYSVAETCLRVKDSLENFNKKALQEKLAYLAKTNEKASELSFYSDEEKYFCKAWNSIVSSHSWVRNIDTFFVKFPNFIGKKGFLFGCWALVFFPIILVAYLLFAVFLYKRKNNFSKKFILLAEVNEKARIENVLHKITSKRFHFQQILNLTKEKKVIALLEKKRESEKNWVEFSDCFSELIKQVYLVNKADLESDPFSEEELAKRKRHSRVYHYVSDVNQKTQFWLVVLVKGVDSIVCSGLFLSCAALFWGAGFVSAFALPYIFVALAATIFIVLLTYHYFNTQKIKQAYQQAITHHLDKKCDYHYRNAQGKWCVREVTQWEKFEYLRKDIELLEQYVRDTLATSEENLLSENYKKVLDEFLNREGIFEYHRRDKTLEEFRSKRSRCEYFLMRAMIFLQVACMA